MLKRHLLSFILLSIWAFAYAQTYTLEDKWVDCGNGVQLLDPYYSPGVSFTWTGSSKDGKANGQGVATKFINGKFESKYEGTYKNGIREGKGTFTHVDGSVKSGIFVNGQLTGRGSVRDDNGNSYEGEFINYRMHGNGTLKWGNGSTFVGFMVNDMPYTGKFTSYTGDVTYIEKGKQVESISETKSTYSPKIGTQVREYFDEEWNRCEPKQAAYYRLITYSAPNIPKGVVKDYYISGELQSEQYPIYVNFEDSGKDFMEGKQTLYHKNGQVEQVRYLYNNIQNGPIKAYYPDGTLQYEAFYDMGEPEGDLVIYYPNGKYQTVAKYRNGKLLNNKHLEFTEDGYPILVYNEDFEVNRQNWETKGQNGTVEVADPNLIIMTANPDRQIGGGIITGFLPMSENMISVTTYQETPGVALVSFLFGWKDWDNYCALSIAGDNYNIAYFKNGVQVMGKDDWKQSDAIHPAINEFRVANVGDKITLYINDQPVGEMGRIYYDGSLCGVTIYNPSEQPVNVQATRLEIQEMAQSQEQIAEYLPSETSDLSVWTSNGSGFFISSAGYIATNYHVVSESEVLQANFTRNGQLESYPAEVVITDPDNDLAIIKITDPKFTSLSELPYGLLPRQKPTGSSVFAMGYPAIGDMGIDVKFTDGKISCKNGFRGDERYYQISAPIQPGNSGGPLFDMEGNVVGINSAYYKGNGFVAQNVNYAIKSPLLKSLIEKVPEIAELKENSKIKNTSTSELTNQISLYEGFVVLVLSKDKQ